MARNHHRRYLGSLALPVAALAFASTPTLAASDWVTVGNSALRTFADYCAPSFFAAKQIDDGRLDEDLAQNYARVLHTRYLSNCDNFLLAEVLPYLAAEELRHFEPALQATGQSTLSTQEKVFIGSVLWAEYVSDFNSCGNNLQARAALTPLSRKRTQYTARLVEDDLLDVAKAYAAFQTKMLKTFGNLPGCYNVVQGAGLIEAVGQLTGFQPQSNPKTSAQETQDFLDTTNRNYQSELTSGGAAPVAELSAVTPGENGDVTQDLPASLDEVAIHDMCRSASEDHERGYALGSAIEGQPVALRVTAQAYIPTEHRLSGTNYLHQGAYAADVWVNVDVSDVIVPDGLRKDGAVNVEGVMMMTEFYSNAMDNCFVVIRATKLELAGF